MSDEICFVHDQTIAPCFDHLSTFVCINTQYVVVGPGQHYGMQNHARERDGKDQGEGSPKQKRARTGLLEAVG